MGIVSQVSDPASQIFCSYFENQGSVSIGCEIPAVRFTSAMNYCLVPAAIGFSQLKVVQ